MDWSLSGAALLLGTFVLALLPAALYALKRRRRPQDGARAGRYRCATPRDEDPGRG